MSSLLLFGDVETTGHDPLKLVNGELVPWHEIIDLVVLLVDPKTLRIEGTFETKIKPEHPERCLPNLVNNYLERAERGEWDAAPRLKPAMLDFFGFLLNRLEARSPANMGGQNFSFDWSFLSVAFALCGFEADWVSRYLHYSRFDTRSMAIQELREPGTPFGPGDYSIRNAMLAKRLGIEPEPPVHTAMNGALKSFEVFRRLEELKKKRRVR